VLRLVGSVGQPLKRSVIIIPEKKYPFKIIEAKAKKGDNINVTLGEVKHPDVTRYILTVENLKKGKGRYSDIIALKTDSTIRPEIRISVYGNIIDKNPKK